MIVIADSGSTKTEWWFVREEKVKKIISKGINPYYQSEIEIKKSVFEDFSHKTFGDVSEVYFYGAGCDKQSAGKLEHTLQSLFPYASFEINDDLLAVARATCQQKEGIACVLGTGSNSCLYDGKKIIDHIPSLGFILGDEGSGAEMGKRLVNMFLKKNLPPSLSNAFDSKYNLTEAEVLKNVYQASYPNRYLASFTAFLSENSSHQYIQSFILESFVKFLKKNVLKYDGASKYSIHFCGSIAHVFKDILKEALSNEGLKIGNVFQSPLAGLKKFHFDNIKS